MTTLYLDAGDEGPMLLHRNPPWESFETIEIIEINEDFGNVLFYGQEFTGDDTFISPSPNELVIWANGRGPVEINVIDVVD